MNTGTEVGVWPGGFEIPEEILKESPDRIFWFESGIQQGANHENPRDINSFEDREP